MQPPEGTKIYMSGKEVPVADLQRGDRLTFYVPEDRMTAQFYPDEQLASAQDSDAVDVPIAAAQQTAPAEESERMAGTLPSTASEMPLLVIFGLGMLGAAGALRLARRR
jgi:LPXTG-motif cell wall-anchored protein